MNLPAMCDACPLQSQRRLRCALGLRWSVAGSWEKPAMPSGAAMAWARPAPGLCEAISRPAPGQLPASSRPAPGHCDAPFSLFSDERHREIVHFGFVMRIAGVRQGHGVAASQPLPASSRPAPGQLHVAIFGASQVLWPSQLHRPFLQHGIAAAMLGSEAGLEHHSHLASSRALVSMLFRAQKASVWPSGVKIP